MGEKLYRLCLHDKNQVQSAGLLRKITYIFCVLLGDEFLMALRIHRSWADEFFFDVTSTKNHHGSSHA